MEACLTLTIGMESSFIPANTLSFIVAKRENYGVC